MKMLKQFVIAALIGFTLTSEVGCVKKGPDDPLISLRTRQSRLCQDWILAKYEKNDVAMDLSGTYSEWLFHDNGSIAQTEEGTLWGFTARETSDGTWSFVDSKKSLSVNINKGTNNYVIDRLSSSELWLTRYDGSDTYFLHFTKR
jgi:hypothetical protein